MPLISEMVHPKGFSFQVQRKIVMLRDVQQLKWADIAKQVKNTQNCHPKPRLCAIYYQKFQSKLGRSPTKYHKCGPRVPYKADADAQKFLIGRMLKERAKSVCTSVTLQLALAREKGVHLSDRHIRKILQKKGYKWLPRRQKRLYSKDLPCAFPLP